jgi:hypothetical protein
MADSSPQGLLLQSMGAPGSEYVTGLNSITGNYFGVQAFEDCTMMGLTVVNVSSSDPQNDGISGAIVPKGATLFGQFTAVQLSGKAVLYKF